MKIKIIITTLLLFLVSCEDSSGPNYLNKDELGYFSFEVYGKFWYPKTDKDILLPYTSHYAVILPMSKDKIDGYYKMYVEAANKKMDSHINFPVYGITSEGKYNIEDSLFSGDQGSRLDNFKFIINDIEYNNLIESKSWIKIESISMNRFNKNNDAIYDTLKASFQITCYNKNDTLIIEDGFFNLISGIEYSFY
jgi:hypothetical protein